MSEAWRKRVELCGGRAALGQYVAEPITLAQAKAFVAAHHYAVHVPPHCLLNLGCFRGGELVGVALWGFGVRPRHTIERLFPSLGTRDYYELNRLCMLDSEPPNGESRFLGLCRRAIRAYAAERRLLFSWADGMRGKPGYVYQADNWLYGGFIRTEFYVTAENEVVHPRLLITRHGRRDRAFTDRLGLRKVWGRQFRYVRFLCGHRERKRLLAESPITWGQPPPKGADCVWRYQDAAEGSRESHEPPRFEGSGQFRHAAPLFTQKAEVAYA